MNGKEALATMSTEANQLVASDPSSIPEGVRLFADINLRRSPLLTLRILGFLVKTDDSLWRPQQDFLRPW